MSFSRENEMLGNENEALFRAKNKACRNKPCEKFEEGKWKEWKRNEMG